MVTTVGTRELLFLYGPTVIFFFVDFENIFNWCNERFGMREWPGKGQKLK